MTKISAALHLLTGKHLLFISVLTDPTIGGVSASSALLGDVVLVESNTLIDFVGPCVIEQTAHETLSEDFQHAEFSSKKGAINQVVDRRFMKKRTSDLITLSYHEDKVTAV